MLAIHDAPGISNLAAGGYSLPLTLVRGPQVHHWLSGTPASAWGIWLPQPRHVFFAICHERALLDDLEIPVPAVTYSRLNKWLRNT